jgi:hypothetical protein
VALNKVFSYLHSREWFSYWKLELDKTNIQLDDGQGMINYLYEQHQKINKPGATLIGDKTPYLNYYLDFIHALYPTAKIIYLIRDYRAVINSYIQSRDYTLDEAIKRCKTSYRIYNKYKHLFRENLLLVKYEELVGSNDELLKQIFNYLNLNFSAQAFELTSMDLGDTRLKHHANVSKPIMKENINKWHQELSENNIKLINSSLKKELLSFDYGLSTTIK